MKMLAFLLIGASLLPEVVQARLNAESVNPINNPGYSANNYKQPHQVTAPSDGTGADVVWVNKMTIGTLREINYKSQLAADHPMGSITYTSHAHFNKLNYKTPYDLQSASSDGENHIRKHHKHSHSVVGH